ncbi:unnamed protein product [Rotaria sordida]|uniref:glutathione transferase n=1 Tax=Rotaria sordida TaxID=392033 RepID=A0A815I4N1_9BILA|nr:unnamed protein product [Rotaria sordida]
MTQSTTDKDQLVLGYWAARGRAESSRLLLHYMKTPFIDKMYQMGDVPDYNRDDWLNEKYKLGLDFPNLPYLIDGDLKLTQSTAILYYLGRKYNLMGNNPKQEALIIMLCEQAYDLRLKFIMLCYGPNGNSPNEQKNFIETTLTENLQQFDRYFSKNKSQFAVDDRPTVADFQLFYCIDCSCSFNGSHVLLEKYINVKAFLQRIRELPQLKDYIIQSQAQVPMLLKRISESMHLKELIEENLEEWPTTGNPFYLDMLYLHYDGYSQRIIVQRLNYISDEKEKILSCIRNASINDLFIAYGYQYTQPIIENYPFPLYTRSTIQNDT